MDLAKSGELRLNIMLLSHQNKTGRDFYLLRADQQTG